MTNPERQKVGQIVKGLTPAMRQALLSAEMCDDGGARMVCRHLYPPTIRGLEDRKLAQFTCLLTPLGLAVRSFIQENGQ